MKKQALTVITLLLTIPVVAQKTLPPSVQKAIPSKYKITSQIYMKPGLMARCEISLAVPNKYGCNDSNLGECDIDVTITQNDEAKKQYLETIYKNTPFESTLPNASNYKPSIDPNNALESYSSTKELKLEQGGAAYYIVTNTCIMDQHAKFESVSFKSLQGSYMKTIEIKMYCAIPASEVIAAAKELYDNLSKINYLAP